MGGTRTLSTYQKNKGKYVHVVISASSEKEQSCLYQIIVLTILFYRLTKHRFASNRIFCMFSRYTIT